MVPNTPIKGHIPWFRDPNPKGQTRRVQRKTLDRKPARLAREALVVWVGAAAFGHLLEPLRPVQDGALVVLRIL